MTFTEDLLRLKGVMIKDVNGNPIIGQGSEINLRINKPTIIENLDLTKALFNRNNREIKFLSYDDLKKWEWMIYQRPIRTDSYDYSAQFPKNQRVYYFALDQQNSPPPFSHEIGSLPKDVIIRYRIKAKLFRLEGPNTGYNNVGPWRPLDKNRSRLVTIRAEARRKRKR